MIPFIVRIVGLERIPQILQIVLRYRKLVEKTWIFLSFLFLVLRVSAVDSRAFSSIDVHRDRQQVIRFFQRLLVRWSCGFEGSGSPSEPITSL